MAAARARATSDGGSFCDGGDPGINGIHRKCLLYSGRTADLRSFRRIVTQQNGLGRYWKFCDSARPRSKSGGSGSSMALRRDDAESSPLGGLLATTATC